MFRRPGSHEDRRDPASKWFSGDTAFGKREEILSGIEGPHAVK
jgi:hypothetical protein